jgi:photosystem I subunit 4
MTTSKTPPDNRQEEGKYNPEDNPGTETNVPTTEEGDTPLDERYRMTGQESGTETRPGAEAEAAGGTVTRPGLPNQGTESR